MKTIELKVIQVIRDNGTLYESLFINNNGLHNENGPAVIFYSDDGKLESEEYAINGFYHRTDGPAIIKYNTLGEITFKYFYLNGKKYFENEYNKQIEIINIRNNSCNGKIVEN